MFKFQPSASPVSATCPECRVLTTGCGATLKPNRDHGYADKWALVLTFTCERCGHAFDLIPGSFELVGCDCH